MKNKLQAALEGNFLHAIYAPHGEIEGVLIDARGEPVQIVFEHHDDASAAAFEGVSAGQAVVIESAPLGPSPKGDAEHCVHSFVRLVSVDGAAPARRRAAQDGPAYRGRVVRFNHARHGVSNGVVLDSGDFIHTKPEGLAKLKLKVGDTVEADGDAQRLVDDSGWAVDATVVNGRAVKPR